ncbi:hypothetical protein TVAGG3_1075920, partial [Trichomonas vaginalis G3]|uniref:uncharacterized protein n=1 Tax=Trichomonas vaginalis (strain ATCC PRA-98 / G3) TaxID=412133 RepID=UPI002156D659
MDERGLVVGEKGWDERGVEGKGVLCAYELGGCLGKGWDERVWVVGEKGWDERGVEGKGVLCA